MRIAHTVSHAVQEGSANAVVFTRGGTAVYKTVTENTAYVLTLAADAVALEIEQGGVVDIKTLFISSDKHILVMLGASDHEPISVEANFPLALVMHETIDKVFVTNDSEEEATLLLS